MAFFLANPVLNPATIIFMGFVLSWKFALFRAVMGASLVVGIASLANRFVKEQEVAHTLLPVEDSPEENENLFVRWISNEDQSVDYDGIELDYESIPRMKRTPGKFQSARGLCLS